MAALIIEGPDGSGKSYTAEFLSSAVGLPIYHSGGPPKSPEEMIGRAKKLLAQDGYIYDRFPVISDRIYGPIIRNKLLFERPWLSYVKWPLIYCRPSKKTILKSELTTKPHKSAEHLKAVQAKIEKIIEAYDKEILSLPDNIRVVVFNRDRDTMEELICVALALLSKTTSQNILQDRRPIEVSGIKLDALQKTPL